jgi:hypothetical protein
MAIEARPEPLGLQRAARGGVPGRDHLSIRVTGLVQKVGQLETVQRDLLSNIGPT